ncbi:MAG: hypothetical protein OEU68_07330 [Nitrospira sp.]|nr:hypothetical protein [Nitrospira sp.]MDH4245033.1 hypothetical protein [Nitrospira sp.]MDH4355962.1 hypothetical protein [Nitrospira sp.]MDH5319364.1 hypothetical protein [Nitrospira sp.]
MKYLVMCDHNEAIINRQNADEALESFRCRRCVQLNPETKALTYRNVRIYQASEGDVRLLEGR